VARQRFDPNKIKVDDIFRAKERRRKELTKLPFEKKIEIVERLKKAVTKIRQAKSRTKENEK
jgi:hypothetical protein